MMRDYSEGQIGLFRDSSYYFDEVEFYKNCYLPTSPPPPYCRNDQLSRDCFKYNDVGEELYVQLPVSPNEEVGLLIISGDNFIPPWPAILDIKKDTPACRCDLKIGDQIKDIFGIPTERLSHEQFIALFAKATDEINMVIRRAVEPTETKFNWFKHPFSSVNPQYEEVIITEDCNVNKEKTTRRNDLKENKFTSFKKKDRVKSKNTISQNIENLLLRKINNESQIYDYNKRRSFTRAPPLPLDSLQNKSNTLPNIKSKNFINRCSKYHEGAYMIPISRPSSPVSPTEGRLIANEIEKLGLKNKSPMLSMISLSTKSSHSTDESVSKTEIESIEDVIPWQSESNLHSKSSLSNNSESLKYLYKTPVSKWRDSLRRKKVKSEQKLSDNLQETNEKSVLHGGNLIGNSFIITLWIGDKEKLGLKLGGGSISPYGASNIYVMEMKRKGTARKVFKTGDEILEIDGISTIGMNVYEANNIIFKLEGNYVEFKIFRPNRK